MKALVILNGEVQGSARERAQARDAAWCIAADGGAHNARRLGLWPDVIVGDLDSVAGELLAELQARGCQVIRHSPRKDETDAELALLEAVRRGATEIRILGALGGRFDHALANILLLTMPGLQGIPTRIVTHEAMISLIHGEAEIAGAIGDTLSLLPLGGDAVGIVTEGLEYPLRDETLYLGPARGVSNVLTAPVARVRLREGLLLAIHYPGRQS